MNRKTFYIEMITSAAGDLRQTYETVGLADVYYTVSTGAPIKEADRTRRVDTVTAESKEAFVVVTKTRGTGCYGHRTGVDASESRSYE